MKRQTTCGLNSTGRLITTQAGSLKHGHVSENSPGISQGKIKQKQDATKGAIVADPGCPPYNPHPSRATPFNHKMHSCTYNFILLHSSGGRRLFAECLACLPPWQARWWSPYGLRFLLLRPLGMWGTAHTGGETVFPSFSPSYAYVIFYIAQTLG